MLEPNNSGLCFRCEFRAQYLELGYASRLECKQVSNSMHGCYQYRPVMPILTVKSDKNDPRNPLSMPMIAARSHRLKLGPDMVIALTKQKDAMLLYWNPIKREKNEKKNKDIK